MIAGPVYSAPASPDRLETWVATAVDPTQAMAAIESSRDKLPPEFEDRLRYIGSDQTLQVMVALDRRTEAVTNLVKASTTWLKWFPKAPRFLARVTPDGLAALLRNEHVTFVEPDYPLDYFLSSSVAHVNARSGVWSFDRSQGKVGGLASGIEGVSAEAATGKGVVVAVSDSGIDKTHLDFGRFNCTPAAPLQPCESRIVKTVATSHLVNAPDLGDIAPTTDFASGHGTHVAGIVAGNGYYNRAGRTHSSSGGDGYNIGVAPQASLLSVKLGDGPSAGLATYALQWQANHAAAFGIRISTNSWGCALGCSFDPRSAQAQTVQSLYQKGVLVTIAVGNNGDTDGTGNNPSTGAGFSGLAQSPYVIGVASYDDDTSRVSSFSSRGVPGTGLTDPATWTPSGEGPQGVRRPDVAAPGESIWSANNLTGGYAAFTPRLATTDVSSDTPDFDPWAYTPMSGTSMATPHVAGAAATLFGVCPSAQPVDVMRALMAGANPSRIYKTTGGEVAAPHEVGYGGLDIRASVDWLRGQGCTTESSTPPGPIPAPSPSSPPTTQPEPEPTAEPTSEPPTPTGSITGTVRAARSGKRLARALVDCGDGHRARTNRSGAYRITDVPSGSYSCTGKARGYRSRAKSITVRPGSTTQLSFRLRSF